jgi:hypothetical protein
MNKTLNPFNQDKQQLSVSSLGESSKSVAEVQASMMLARANPRNQIQAMDRILNACTRPSLAEIAVYQYARGGQDISGPSIRLAEALAQTWGNLNYGVRELEQSSGVSTVQAFAWDIETNTRKEMTFQVPHVRYSRAKGNTKLEDPRDIYEHVANQGARRLRACILAIIPGDVVESAVRQCELTMNSSADVSNEGIKRIIDSFAAYSVSQQQIEKRIQRRIDVIQPAQVVQLKKIYASMRDGMSSVSDWFEEIKENKTLESILPKTVDKEMGEIKDKKIHKQVIPETKKHEENKVNEQDNWAESESLIDKCKTVAELIKLVSSMKPEYKESKKNEIREKQNSLRLKSELPIEIKE